MNAASQGCKLPPCESHSHSLSVATRYHAMISWSLYSSWIIRYSINIFLHSVLWQQNWCLLGGCEPVAFMADCGLCGNCPICVRFELFLVRMYKVTTAGHQYDSDFLTSSRYSLWLQNVTNCCLLQFCISQRLPIILSIPGDAWVFFQIANIMNWVCPLLQKCNSNWGHRFCMMVCLNFGQISIYYRHPQSGADEVSGSHDSPSLLFWCRWWHPLSCYFKACWCGDFSAIWWVYAVISSVFFP